MQAQRKISLSELLKNRSYITARLKSIRKVIRFTKQARYRGWTGYANCFEYSASQFPNNIAIKYNDTQYTYQELNEKINQVAHYLRSQGISNKDVVALYMENRAEYLIYLLAISKLGAIASLINNSQFGQVLTHSITLVNPKTAIVGEELIEHFDAVKNDCDIKQDVFFVKDSENPLDTSKLELLNNYINIDDACKDYPISNVRAKEKIKPTDPCIYIYTSGTTGLPKATIQKHNKMVATFSSLSMFVNPLKQSDVLYSTLPLYHATALLVCWNSAIANGATFVIKRKFSASEFWTDVEKYGVTAFGYVGELCRYLVNQPESKKEKNHNISVVMGNGLKPELWSTFKDRFNIDEIRELYASSEGNVGSFNLFNLDETVGILLGQVAIVAFDNDTEKPIRDKDGRMVRVKKGEPGLLLGKVTIATPFDGYTQADKNKDKLYTNVFKKGDKWFNTGDLIRDVGYKHIQFVDRTGDTFRWKGENISTSQIENISNQFPGIEESIAYGVEVPDTNGRAGMIAITLSQSNNKFDEKAFYSFLSKELPAYAVPLFVRIQEKFEQTGTFKYQRSHLRTQAFELDSVEDPLKVTLPGSNCYETLTPDLLSNIKNSQYKF